MHLHFHEPPPAQQSGGVGSALRSLEASLRQQGLIVDVDPPPNGKLPDVVHFHGLWQPRYPQIARRYLQAGVPICVSPHGMLQPWALRHKWWKKYPYWLLRESRWVSRAAAVLATSEMEAAAITRRLSQTPVVELPLGMTSDVAPDYVAARKSLGWSDDETILLFLSRLHPVKGLDLLLTALSAEPAWRDSRLLVVGPASSPDYLARRQEFARVHASRLPRIEWIPEVHGDAKWPLLQGADLFCAPSHSENFGLSILEACQVGTPVLTTTRTPWGTWLGENGYICEPTAADVGAALRRFRASSWSPARRQNLASWARERFHWDAVGPRYAALYAQLAAQASPIRHAA